MRPEEIQQEIDKLNISEKLILIEDVWDSIARGNSEIPMPEWQKQELDERYKNFKAGNYTLHDWQSTHKVIRNKYK